MTGPDSNPKGPAAIDRKVLSKQAFAKTTRWPRTDRRVARLESALRHRQPDLSVVLENVHDRHNVSAVLRTCDAVGIQTVHLIYTYEQPPGHAWSQGIGWHSQVDGLRAVELSGSVFRHVEGCRYESPDDSAQRNGEVDLRCRLPQPVAVVFGNEMRGAGDVAIQQSDGCIYIPMVGMVQSLNVSVSCAFCHV